MNSTRYHATVILHSVMQGHSLSEMLSRTLNTITNERDKSFLQAIVYGVCRFYPRLEFILNLLLSSPLKKKDDEVKALLLIGLYQLSDMKVAEHAAVSETVKCVMLFKKTWAKNLVNAVLRNYLRKKEEINAALTKNEEACYAHPTWWIETIKKDWPEEWHNILNANNQHPPFSLRLNLQKKSRPDYLKELKKLNVEAQPIPFIDSGIHIQNPVPVNDLPGFVEGMVSVQDGAAQLAAHLLEISPGMRVLDACAAPGGKLIHLLELEPHLEEIIALEKEEKRILLIKENLDRCQLAHKVFCHHADVLEIDKWWTGKQFDRMLVDAPCSASGVIRRHPDIKLLRKPTDIPSLAQLQFLILKTIWPLLKPNGILLYATCSIFSAENEAVMHNFFQAQSDAIELVIQEEWGIPRSIGRQMIPGKHNMDGFYYAKVRKRRTTPCE